VIGVCHSFAADKLTEAHLVHLTTAHITLPALLSGLGAPSLTS
jgi:hypothetical protein